MVRENPYKDIENQIRERLEFVRDSRTETSTITSSDPFIEGVIEELRESLIVAGKAMTLKTAKNLLSKLPENYSALPELNRMYLELE